MGSGGAAAKDSDETGARQHQESLGRLPRERKRSQGQAVPEGLGGAHSRWCDRNSEELVGNWGALVRSRPCRAGLRR